MSFGDAITSCPSGPIDSFSFACTNCSFTMDRDAWIEVWPSGRRPVPRIWPERLSLRFSKVAAPIAFDRSSAPSTAIRDQPRIWTSSASSISVLRASAPQVSSSADTDWAKVQKWRPLPAARL